jgi:pimeloyl-ACP methyl ester carboxylesterase
LWLSDIQGHGDSDVGGAFVGWNRSAELAAQAFEQHQHVFGDVSRYAMGHSLGGVLTSLVLAQHPALFKQAVLLDPVLLPRRLLLGARGLSAMGMSKHLPNVANALKRRSHWPSREEAVNALRGRGTYKGWTESAMAAFGEHALRPAVHGNGSGNGIGAGVVLKCPPSREAEVFGSVPKGLWLALRKVQTPTMVLHGDNTYPFIAPSARHWAKLNAKVSSMQVAGNHCFMQCSPEQTADQVVAFLLRRSAISRPMP